jgi:hypothetical protein
MMGLMSSKDPWLRLSEGNDCWIVSQRGYLGKGKIGWLKEVVALQSPLPAGAARFPSTQTAGEALGDDLDPTPSLSIPGSGAAQPEAVRSLAPRGRASPCFPPPCSLGISTLDKIGYQE